MSPLLPLAHPGRAGSYVRARIPVDVAALVCSPNEARSFARPLTISSLGVRPTVLRGPGNWAGVKLAPLIRFRKKPQQAVAHATAEGKALAARIFQLNFDTQAELHALLMRATELAGGKP